MFHNPLVFLADLVAPPLIGFVFCLLWGVPRGLLLSIVPMLLAVFVLFFFQLSPGGYPDGSSRFEGALGYMLFEIEIWVATFAVGAALGWAVGRARAGKV